MSGGHLLGVHPADDGGLPMAVRRAAAAGARALQCFTAPPTYYNEKVGFAAKKVEALHAALAAAGLAPRQVLVHAAYVLNTASPDETKALRARAGLAKEYERTTAAGAYGCCFHPGSAGDATRPTRRCGWGRRSGTRWRASRRRRRAPGSSSRTLPEPGARWDAPPRRSR